MGGQKSKSERIHDIVVDMTTDAMIQPTMNCIGSIYFLEDFLPENNLHPDLEGLNDLQSLLRVNVGCMYNSQIRELIQERLVSMIMDTATAPESKFPAQIAASDAKQVENNIRAIVARHLSKESISSFDYGLTPVELESFKKGEHVLKSTPTEYRLGLGRLILSVSEPLSEELARAMGVADEVSHVTLALVAAGSLLTVLGVVYFIYGS